MPRWSECDPGFDLEQALRFVPEPVTILEGLGRESFSVARPVIRISPSAVVTVSRVDCVPAGKSCWIYDYFK